MDKGVVRLSVPTRFLRNWIQSHYSEKVLTRWQAEEAEVTRLELSVRSATIRPIVAKPKLPEAAQPLHNGRDGYANGGDSPLKRAVHDGARGARRLAARPAPELSTASSSGVRTRWRTPPPSRSRPAGTANR